MLVGPVVLNNKIVSKPLKALGGLAVGASLTTLGKDRRLTHDEKMFLAKSKQFAEIHKDVFNKNSENELNGNSERIAEFNIKSGVIPRKYKNGELSPNAIKILFETCKNIISKEDFDYFAQNKIPITDFDNKKILTARYYNSVLPAFNVNSEEYDRLKANIVAKESQKIDQAACDRKMVLVTGLPAAGKTTVVKSILKDKFSEYYNLDADTYKEGFEPYYLGGKNSDVVHKASTSIAKSPEIMGRIYKEGRNFIRQTVSPEIDLQKIIKTAKDNGFEVTVVHVNVDPEKSKERTVKRFETEGRYLDPARISELTHQSIPYNKIVDQLLKNTDVEIYEFDNNGTQPQLLNHYSKRS